MFGIEFPEILVFSRQLGLALAGAACLWGFVFTKWSRHDPKKPSCLLYEWLGAKLLLLLAGGVFLALTSWLLLLPALDVSAHEGIALLAKEQAVLQQNQAVAPAIFLLVLVFALLLAARRLWPKVVQEQLEWFYALHLALIMFLMALFSWQGELNTEQLFFWGHSMHSILTLGTVLVLDFLFLLSKSSALLKQHVYPLFPFMSKAIWVGLGIDFLSVALVFQEAIALTPKFFFMQTLIGILIINGVLLAGPITKNMLASVKERGKQLSAKWERIGDIAGVISIASWTTITLVDSFEHLALTYVQLFGAYLALLAVLFVGHMVFEYFQKEPPVVLGLTGA